MHCTFGSLLWQLLTTAVLVDEGVVLGGVVEILLFDAGRPASGESIGFATPQALSVMATRAGLERVNSFLSVLFKIFSPNPWFLRPTFVLAFLEFMEDVDLKRNLKLKIICRKKKK